MTTIVRFAPSPTGRLHIGNIRPALINWLYARKNNGKYMLRLDDTDQERSTEEFAEQIKQDLTWLGLTWDLEAKQSDRFAEYDAATEKLKKMGRLYACYETADELERKRKRQLSAGRPPVYDRKGLKLTDEEKAKFEAEGRKPHWRFLLEERTVEWKDLVRGDQKVDAASLSDPVLIRADGTYLYTLPSVVDDIDFGITHIIRGEDHVANSGAQIQLFEALGAKAPEMGHHNLLVGAQGEALSKRLGSLAIHSFREEGLEPLAVVSHSATIGSSVPIAPYKATDDVVDMFDISNLSRAPARFDPEELKMLNAKLLHDLDYSSVEENLKNMGVEANETFWNIAKENISLLHEVKDWWDIVNGPIEPIIEDKAFCIKAAELAPEDPWDENTWKTWTDAIKAETGAKGKSLFMPLRLALTGQKHGPDMGSFILLIGREKCLERLKS